MIMGTTAGTDVTSIPAVQAVPLARAAARERGMFTRLERYLLGGFAVMVYSALSSRRSWNAGNYQVNALIYVYQGQDAVPYL